MAADISYSKKNKRQISQFVGRQLLYDYLTDKLDAERKAAIHKLIEESEEVRSELEVLKSGMAYSASLKPTEVSLELIHKIKEPSTYFQGLFDKIRWTEWPDGLKLGIEVLMISVIVVVLISVVPWNRVVDVPLTQSTGVVLTEVKKDRIQDSLETSIGSKSEVPEELTYQDDMPKTPVAQDEIGPKVVDKVSSQVTAKKMDLNPDYKSPDRSLDIVKIDLTGHAHWVVPTQNTAMPKTPPPEQPSQASETGASIPTEVTGGRGQGSLYRGAISVSNLIVTSQKFVEKINEFGGRKAGEVDLGWKKGEDTYFHFTIPEARYETMVNYLNEYGKIKIQKEKHERIMPEGILRMIITVSEDKQRKPSPNPPPVLDAPVMEPVKQAPTTAPNPGLGTGNSGPESGAIEE